MSVEYKEVVCSANECWDKIAFGNYGDGYEMYFPIIMEANRQYSRTLAFDGGERVKVPLSGDAPIIVSNGDPSSQKVVSIIETPW
jgi:hypothetical protein